MLFSSLNQDSHTIVRSWHIFFIAINCKDEVSFSNSQHFQLNAQLSLPDIISKNSEFTRWHYLRDNTVNMYHNDTNGSSELT